MGFEPRKSSCRCCRDALRVPGPQASLRDVACPVLLPGTQPHGWVRVWVTSSRVHPGLLMQEREDSDRCQAVTVLQQDWRARPGNRGKPGQPVGAASQGIQPQVGSVEHLVLCTGRGAGRSLTLCWNRVPHPLASVSCSSCISAFLVHVSDWLELETPAAGEAER